MKDSNSLMLTKQRTFKNIINKLKNIFYKKNKEETPARNEVNNTARKEEFIRNIKIPIDTEISLLKLKLESGEIKAIELTDNQIEQLQKIYEEEILQKKRKLERLKKNT